MSEGCVFCWRIREGKFERESVHAVAFAPLKPVTPGHLLIVPRMHVANAGTFPYVYRNASLLAATIAQELGEDFNLITSAGVSATQTIWHLHIHYVPRRAGDGLHLPWTEH